MIITTTDHVEGRRVIDYLGVVTGEAIIGVNVFRDFFAGIRDIVGGRSAAYEAELRKAKDLALGELKQQAAAAGCNAVVAVDLGERHSHHVVVDSLVAQLLPQHRSSGTANPMPGLDPHARVLGIVEHGLFIGLTSDVIVAGKDGIRHLVRQP